MVKLYRVLFWLAVAVTLFMALDPHPPQMPGSDKFQHALAFAVLFIGATIAYPAARLFPLAALLSGFGATIELLQALPIFGRDCDVMDWVADTAAIAAAFVIVVAGRAIWRGDTGRNLQS